MNHPPANAEVSIRHALSLGALLLVALPFSSWAESAATGKAAAEMTSADVVSCVRRNIAERGSLRQLKLTATDKKGNQRSFEMKLYWKPSKGTEDTQLTLQVMAPPDLAGVAYLVRSAASGESVYVYLPAVGRVQRLAELEASRPLWGTDVTYAEIQQIHGTFKAGTTKRVADAKVFDRPTFVLETDTDVEETGYDTVRSYVDQQTCVLLESRLFSKTGKLAKVVKADLSTLLEVEPWWMVLGYVVHDTTTNSRTRIELSDVMLLDAVPDSLFSPEAFYRTQAGADQVIVP